MNYPMRGSKNFIPPAPMVRVSVDDKEYFFMNDLNNKKRNRIFELMEKNRPGLFHMIQNDDFIAALITECNAQLMIEKVKK